MCSFLFPNTISHQLQNQSLIKKWEYRQIHQWKMEDCSPDKKSGCVTMLFRKAYWPRRSTSTGTILIVNNNVPIKASPSPKRRRGGSYEAAFLGDPKSDEQLQAPPCQKPISRAPLNQPKPQPYNYQDHGRKPMNAMSRPIPNQGPGYGRRLSIKESMSLSTDLYNMINDHQRFKGSNNHVRASSGNAMLYGHLGNLTQPGGGNLNSSNLPNATTNLLDFLPKTAHEMGSNPNGRYTKTLKCLCIRADQESAVGVTLETLNKYYL